MRLPRIDSNHLIVVLVAVVLVALVGVFCADPAQLFQSAAWEDIWIKISFYYLLVIVLRSGALLILSSLDFLYERDRGLPTSYPMVSIVIPCFNEAKVITEAIHSVLSLNYPNYEVIVVDDGSFDATLIEALKFEEKFRLRVVFQENAGKAAALNRGISEAVGQFFLCMDADSALNRDVLMMAMPYFEKDANLAAVAGSVYVGNAYNTLARFQKLEYTIGLNLFKRAQSFLNTVTIVPGPIGVFRKAVVEKVGGYHADTFAEDSDLSIRLLLNGFNIKYCESMVANTEAPEDFRSLMTQRYRWSRGMAQAIFKNLQWLRRDKINVRNAVILLYMITETLIIPSANFGLSLVTLSSALNHGFFALGPFFVGLTILDFSTSIYAIAVEKENMSLFALCLVNRMTYGLSLEMMRFFAMIDEFFGIPMKWGTLQRKGMGRA